jgi:hypothetical protein
MLLIPLDSSLERGQLVSQTTKSIPDAVQVLLQQFQRLTVGEPITYDRMAIFPIFAGGNGKGRESLRYLTLEQALADGAVQVTERGSATVPELTLRNAGQAMVLIFDGEEIIGGQQNRVVNTTFLIPADATFDLPVSCVERGRWHTTSSTFSSGESAYHSLRAAKHQQVSLSLKTSGRPISDQSEIWAEVAVQE